MLRTLPLASLAVSLAGVPPLTAAPCAAQVKPLQRIFDAAYFDGLASTRIDFETDGAGNPIVLGAGETKVMPFLAYQNLGLDVQPAINWVNDGSPDFDAAQALGASPEIAIPSAIKDLFTLNFNPPVRSFGAWVVNNPSAAVAPRFEAFNQIGQHLGTVEWTREFHDGVCGLGQYGFMGLVTDEPIASIRVIKDSAIFDDLRFSTEASVEPYLSLNGTCPGPHALRLVGAAPSAPVLFLASLASGTVPLSVSACAGASTLLGDPITVLGSATADFRGEALVYAKVPPTVCGLGWAQAIDLSLCSLSNAAAVGPDPQLACSGTADGALPPPPGRSGEFGGVEPR